MQSHVRVLFVHIAIVVGTLPAHAFDGKEHARVSKAGLQIAMAACEENPKCGLDDAMRTQLAPFLDSGSLLSYGTLVRSVDYRLNPLQIMQTQGSQETLPAKPEDLDPHLLRVLTDPSVPFLRAASANDTHFQGELIAGLRHAHSHAVDVAAHEQNLFAALLLNSIADHYLQDFFAPGHIVTPRFGLHDAAALGLHNRYNSLGSMFIIDAAGFKQLEPLLQHLAKTEIEPKLLEARVGTAAVPLWGDSELWRSPEQELLMILIEARSVLDILESFKSGDTVDSFKDVEWIPTARVRPPDSVHKWRLAGGRLPFGRYQHLGEHVRVFNAGSILGLSAGAHVLMSRGVTRTRTAYQFDFIVAGQPPLRAPRERRGEVVPAHFHDRSRSLRVGYVYEHNDDEIGRGPALRAVWALPLIHSQVSGDIAWKTYLRRSTSERKIAYGVRFQTGFSVLNLDLGVGRDYTFTPDGLEPALAVRFGVTAAGPLSSIPVIGKVEKSLFRWQRRRREKQASRGER